MSHQAEQPKPAGFWIRYVAAFLDILILEITLSFFNFFVRPESLLLLFCIQLPWLLYKPIMEAFYGATLGKMALKIRVIDTHGNNLTLRKAYIRFLPFLVPTVIVFLTNVILILNLPEVGLLLLGGPFTYLYGILNFVMLIDCAVAAFAHRKRAVHDMMAGSFCVYRKTHDPV